MELTTKLDDREFQRKLRQLSALRGRPLEQFTRQSARRFAVSLAKGTVPVGLGVKAKRAGDRAVKHDVFKVFMPESQLYEKLEPEQRKQLAFLMNNGTPRDINKFLSDNGINVRRMKTANKNYYQSRRITNKGRVPRNEKPSVAVAGDKIYNLIRQIQNRVLRAKNGWAMCARQLGGVRGLDKPIWSAKGQPQPTGRVTERRTANGITYRLHNLVEHVSFMLSRQTVATSWKIENNVLRREIERAIKSRSR